MKPAGWALDASSSASTFALRNGEVWATRQYRQVTRDPSAQLGSSAALQLLSDGTSEFLCVDVNREHSLFPIRQFVRFDATTVRSDNNNRQFTSLILDVSLASVIGLTRFVRWLLAPDGCAGYESSAARTSWAGRWRPCCCAKGAAATRPIVAGAVVRGDGTVIYGSDDGKVRAINPADQSDRKSTRLNSSHRT